MKIVLAKVLDYLCECQEQKAKLIVEDLNKNGVHYWYSS